MGIHDSTQKRRFVTSVGFHLLWYTFLCPLFASITFIFIALVTENSSPLGALVDASLAGILSTLFVLPKSFLVASIMSIAVLFCSRPTVALLNLFVVAFCPWFLLIDAPFLFLDRPVLVFVFGILFAALTAMIYSRLRIYALIASINVHHESVPGECS